ncbi:unnamed protein product [Lampetra fluviatilis]
MVLQLLAAVYGPPSDCRQLFYDRQRGAKESPLAYRTALLALAKTAFPRMDEEGVDAMVTEKILLLADELDIVVLAQDDTEMCSLRAVRHIHANLLSQRRKASKAAASHTVAATTLPSEEICAVDRPTEWRSGVRPAWDGPSRQDQPKSSGALTRCYNCGLRGHVASGCRAPRQRGATPQQDVAPLPKLHQQTPASRGTPHVSESQTDWDLQIPGVLAAYRMAPNAATGFSPFFLMYGREPNPPVPTQLQISTPHGKSKLTEHVKFNIAKLTEAREAAMQNSELRQKANERLRLGRTHVLQWKPGPTKASQWRGPKSPEPMLL